jgi:probable rRNA maturation factor
MPSSDSADPADPPISPLPERYLILRQRTVAADWEEVERFLRRLSAELARRPFSVCMLSDRGMRGYNKRFRHRDEPTDVLSFPLRFGRGEPAYLGDILISAETARSRAQRLGMRPEEEIKALALHGVLHLLGYNHENDRGKMARQERRWGARLGLSRTLLGKTSGRQRH